jgi:chemotaxis protein methyltransferase CheR
MPDPGRDALVDALIGLLARETGHRVDAIQREAVVRATRNVDPGGDPREAAASAWARPATRTSLLDAVLVPETSFFRHPEQFDAVLAEALPILASKEGRIAVWSAGCATGEEAYSLAAALLFTLPDAAAESLDVLGTDLSEKSLAVASEGVYSSRPAHEARTLPFPVCRGLPDGRFRIDAGVRAVTRFVRHNLLDSPPEGPNAFDLVVCRNVLIYFDERALDVACKNLALACAPGGVLLFGTLDVPEVPKGLVRIGPPNVNIFVKTPARPVTARPPTRPPTVRPSRPPSGPDSAFDPIALHLAVLESLEKGDAASADVALSQLHVFAPDYLPGIFEQGLRHVRAGETLRAQERMRKVLARAEALPESALVAGPENLPASYYRSAARAYLARHEHDGPRKQ